MDAQCARSDPAARRRRGERDPGGLPAGSFRRHPVRRGRDPPHGSFHLSRARLGALAGARRAVHVRVGRRGAVHAPRAGGTGLSALDRRGLRSRRPARSARIRGAHVRPAASRGRWCARRARGGPRLPGSADRLGRPAAPHRPRTPHHRARKARRPRTGRGGTGPGAEGRSRGAPGTPPGRGAPCAGLRLPGAVALGGGDARRLRSARPRARVPALRRAVCPGGRRDGRERADGPRQASRGAGSPARDEAVRVRRGPPPGRRRRRALDRRGSAPSGPGACRGPRRRGILGPQAHVPPRARRGAAPGGRPRGSRAPRRRTPGHQPRARAPRPPPLQRPPPRSRARPPVVRGPPLRRADRELLELELAQPRSTERAVPLAVLPGSVPRPRRRARGRLQRPARGTARGGGVSARRRCRPRRDGMVALASVRGRRVGRGRRRRAHRPRLLPPPARGTPRRTREGVRRVHDLRRMGPRRHARARPARQRRAPVGLAPRDARPMSLPLLPEARPAHRAAEGNRARHHRVARRR